MQPQQPTVRGALILLGLADGADRGAVTQAYRRLARVTHPDLSDATDAAERFHALTMAYRRALDAVPTPATEPAAATRSTRVRDQQHLPPAVAHVHCDAVSSWNPIIFAGPVQVAPLPVHRRRSR